MLDSIWTRSPWEAFVIFAFGLALWETFAARAAVRLGWERSLVRPIRFGALAGLIFGVSLIAYSTVVSTAAFSGIEGNAPPILDKLRLASFPTSAAFGRLESTNVAFSTAISAALLLAQETILGAAFAFVFRKSRLFAASDDAESPIA